MDGIHPQVMKAYKVISENQKFLANFDPSSVSSSDDEATSSTSDSATAQAITQQSQLIAGSMAQMESMMVLLLMMFMQVQANGSQGGSVEGNSEDAANASSQQDWPISNYYYAPSFLWPSASTNRSTV